MAWQITKQHHVATRQNNTYHGAAIEQHFEIVRMVRESGVEAPECNNGGDGIDGVFAGI